MSVYYNESEILGIAQDIVDERYDGNWGEIKQDLESDDIYRADEKLVYAIQDYMSLHLDTEDEDDEYELLEDLLHYIESRAKTSHRANRKRANLMSLDEALQQVANASFYEDKQITPETDGNGNIAGYRVEDDYGMNTDDWLWTYDQGLMDTDSVSEASRLMDHYEHFSSPHHIRYNMPESVKALENGQTVTFAYAIVRDDDAIFDEETQEFYDADGDPTDDVAGWILTADWF